MPRNGSGVWSPPSGTVPAIPLDPITSAMWNAFIADLTADANSARPLTAGGTAATSAAGARTNLGVDVAVAFATKSGAYTAVASDTNATLRFSAAATLTLTAAATLANNWHVTVIADGGAVTIDPDDDEQINGEDTIIIPQGFTATILCTGSAFFTTSINSVLAELAGIGVGLMANYLTGYTLSNNASDATNDIDIAPGVCMDSTNTSFIKLASGLTKRLDAAWAVGTGQGCLDTGSLSNTTYHFYAIKRLDTGVVDVIASASASGPLMPDNYTVDRRIGSVLRLAGTIVAFSQNGDEFLLDVTALDVDVSNQGTTAILRALNVPLGIKVDALMRVRGSNASGWVMIISSPDVADRAPSATGQPLADLGASTGIADRTTLRVRTDTSAQVRSRSSQASTDLQISTYGWIDTRGK